MTITGCFLNYYQSSSGYYGRNFTDDKGEENGTEHLNH